MEHIVNESKHLSMTKILKLIMETVHYDDYLKTLDQAEERFENVKELMMAMEEYQMKNPTNSLSSFLDEISLYTEADDSKNKTHNSVSLMTIHFAKGTEFKVVFIAGMNEGIFPSRHLSGETNMEEERRIAYVGFTRSKEMLYLTCNLGFSPISGENLIPSRFIKEIGKKNYRAETSQMIAISKADLD
jgi:DNA helicase-2/ATP-dependent DNA helicase PcrA